MKKLLLVAFIGCLVLARQANAQFLTGSVLATPDGGGGSVTSSSFTMIRSNIIDSTFFPSSGFGPNSFYTLVPSNSLLFAYSSSSISGLSSTPTALSINNFLIFSYPEPGFGVSTTPVNRFDFNLSSIAETYTGNADDTAVITGTGTIVDTTGAFQDTPGQVTIDFLHPDLYQITLQAVPEPGTISMVAAGLLGIWASRRRKSRRV